MSLGTSAYYMDRAVTDSDRVVMDAQLEEEKVGDQPENEYGTERSPPKTCLRGHTGHMK